MAKSKYLNSMSHTYASTLVHCVFSTKERVESIQSDLQPKLWAYMGGIARMHGCVALAVGGTENHAHVLLQVPPRIAIAEAVKKVKAGSSKWIHDNHRKDFAWQEGYGAFSVSVSHLESTVSYIRNQTEHHRKRDFQQELVAFLKKHGITYDPTHVWG